MLYVTLPALTVLALAGAYLAYDKWGHRDRLGEAKALRDGTSDLSRRRRLSDTLDANLALFHERQAAAERARRLI